MSDRQSRSLQDRLAALDEGAAARAGADIFSPKPIRDDIEIHIGNPPDVNIDLPTPAQAATDTLGNLWDDVRAAAIEADVLGGLSEATNLTATLMVIAAMLGNALPPRAAAPVHVAAQTRPVAMGGGTPFKTAHVVTPEQLKALPAKLADYETMADNCHFASYIPFLSADRYTLLGVSCPALDSLSALTPAQRQPLNGLILNATADGRIELAEITPIAAEIIRLGVRIPPDKLQAAARAIKALGKMPADWTPDDLLAAIPPQPDTPVR